MHKRLLALLLAGIMVLGTACASKEEKTPLEEEKPAEEPAENPEPTKVKAPKPSNRVMLDTDSSISIK